MNARYVQVMGALPDAEEAVTDEQISAMSHLLASGRPPAADFSIWGPHGTRLLRRVRIQGMKMDADGNFRRVELYGPESLAVWTASYMVFVTAMIMANSISRPSLSRYLKRITHYSNRYGAAVWPMIYQADCRARFLAA